MRAERGNLTGDRPDHQHPLLDSASDEVVVGMLSQRGPGDDMACQFHDDILPFPPSTGKPGNECVGRCILTGERSAQRVVMARAY
ncbi:MAG: hypothetical protein ABSA97_09250 [Verrucomicrobiia bacterium]